MTFSRGEAIEGGPIGMHFISKGLSSANDGKTFATLFEKRDSGDYDEYSVTREW